MKEENKKVEELKKDVVVDEDGQVFKREKKDFLRTDITLTVMGYSYGSKWSDTEEGYVQDTSCFQIQTVTMNNETSKLDKHTLKINIILTEEEIDKMLGKTYFFKDVNLHTIKDSAGRIKLAYSTEKLGEEKKVDKEVFVLNNYTREKILISNIVNEVRKTKMRNPKTGLTKEKEVDTGSCLIQRMIRDGKRLDLKTIKLTDIDKSVVEDLLNKSIKVDNIIAFKGMNGMIYETSTKPTI